jgi:hypothetical protein
VNSWPCRRARDSSALARDWKPRRFSAPRELVDQRQLAHLRRVVAHLPSRRAQHERHRPRAGRDVDPAHDRLGAAVVEQRHRRGARHRRDHDPELPSRQEVGRRQRHVAVEAVVDRATAGHVLDRDRDHHRADQRRRELPALWDPLPGTSAIAAASDTHSKVVGRRPVRLELDYTSAGTFSGSGGPSYFSDSSGARRRSITALSSAPSSSTTFVSHSHTSRITAPANAP